MARIKLAYQKGALVSGGITGVGILTSFFNPIAGIALIGTGLSGMCVCIVKIVK